MRRIETAARRFLRAFAGYRMTDHKCNEDIRERLGIIYIYTVIKTVIINY
jgi:hypothetical protein